MKLSISITSANSMEGFGTFLGKAAKHTDFIWLTGVLGAGKTTFAKGFLTGLGACETITSPSFLIAKEHPGARIPAVHLDLFRIDSKEKFSELGLDEYLSGEWFVICEWADKLELERQKNGIHFLFEVINASTRKITATLLSNKTDNTILSAMKDFKVE